MSQRQEVRSIQVECQEVRPVIRSAERGKVSITKMGSEGCPGWEGEADVGVKLIGIEGGGQVGVTLTGSEEYPGQEVGQ